MSANQTTLPAATEFGLHRACIDWAKWHVRQYPELQMLFHVPNGEKRDVRTAARLRVMGVKAGVPDLVLPVPRGQWHGLFIELKAGKGRPTRAQQNWIDSLRFLGYRVEIVKTIEQFEELVVGYLSTTGPATR